MKAEPHIRTFTLRRVQADILDKGRRVPDAYNVQVGEAVLAHMGGRTKKQLAELIELDASSVTRKLRGDTPFSIAEISKIEAWLGLAPGQIMQEITGGTADLAELRAEIRELRSLLESLTEDRRPPRGGNSGGNPS